MDAGLEIGDAWNLLEEAAAQIDRIRAELSEFKRTEPLKRGELKDLRTEIRAAESYILEMEAWAVAQIENGSVFSDPPTRNFPLNVTPHQTLTAASARLSTVWCRGWFGSGYSSR